MYIVFLFYAATSLMIRNIVQSSTTNTIALHWEPPLYSPDHYFIETSCQLQNYNEAYTIRKKRVDGNHTSLTVRYLHPGSICFMKLLAIYNEASRDPGIVCRFYTLPTGKTGLGVNLTYIRSLSTIIALGTIDHTFWSGVFCVVNLIKLFHNSVLPQNYY